MRFLKTSLWARALALLLCLTLILTPVVGGTLAGIVARTQSIINTFLSGLDPVGELVIRKEVTHPFSDGYIIPGSLRFDFHVCLGPDYAGADIETSHGTRTADDSGTITVTIAPNEAVSITGIRKGTAVTVTEASSDGFTPTGGPEKTITIGAGIYQLLYTNAYAPDPADAAVTVTGTKLLDGRDWLDGDRFSFLLEYKQPGAGEWTTLGTTSVEYDPADPNFDQFDFTDLLRTVTFDTAGEYAFRISEEAGTIGGIIYDEAVSYFDILIGDDDMDGALELQNVAGYQNAIVLFDGEAYNVEVTITNRYAPEGTADVTIPIQKTVRSYSGEDRSAAGYTFELYDENGMLVARSEETSAAGEIAMTLTFDAADAGETFHYTLIETGSGETVNGLTYDSRVYDITVTVVDNLDGTISATIEGLEGTYTFVNVYDPVNAEVALEGSKTLLGRDLRDSEFTFALYAVDSTFQIADGQKPLLTAANRADGTFAFAPIIYNRVGTYRYAVAELASGPSGGITYDPAVYYVVVNVTDAGGALWADWSITDNLGNPAVLRFTNSYAPAAVSLSIEGTKVLHGMDISDKQFRFLLYAADENYQIHGAPKPAFNDANGRFAFEPITWTEPGTYWYVVAEDTSSQLDGMEYDERTYGVQVTVTDDGNGSLTAELDLTVIGGTKMNSITFVNTYTAPTEPTEPTTPTEPSEPTTPTEPTDPTTPTEPTDPTTPTEPSEPTTPTEPSEPTPPTEPSDPTTPSEPTDPTTPSEPTTPTTPTDPTVPTETGGSGGENDPEFPDHTTPTDPSKPDTPPTGDTSNVELYLILMLVSILGFMIVLLMARVKKPPTGKD